MKNGFTVTEAFDRSAPERPQWWASKIVDRDLRVIAECYGNTKQEAGMRAQQMAAATELLAACRALVAEDGDRIDQQAFFELRDMARLAIARAEGRVQ